MSALMALCRWASAPSARRCALAAGLVLPGAPHQAGAQSQPVSPALRRTISELLDSAVAAGRRHDTLRLRSMLTAGFRFIHSTGRVNDIPEFVSFLAAIQPETTRAVSPPEYAVIGDAVFVYKYEATWVPRRGWAEFRSTDVVVRAPAHTDRGGAAAEWRWAMHQSTALPVAPSTWLTVPDSLLNEYAGDYVNTAGFVRNVRRDGDHLMITAVGGSQISYRAVTSTSFHAERGDAYAVFGRDERGRIAHLEILQPTGGERYVRRRRG